MKGKELLERVLAYHRQTRLEDIERELKARREYQKLYNRRLMLIRLIKQLEKHPELCAGEREELDEIHSQPVSNYAFGDKPHNLQRISQLERRRLELIGAAH